MAGFLIGILLLLFALGVPVAVALGLASALTIWITGDVPLLLLAQRAFTSIDSFPLMAVPFFILAGTLMETGGISRRLIGLANALTGHIVGGLGLVVVVTSAFFAAISGSSAATAAAIGTIMIPAMIKRGYHRSFAGGTQAISAELGVIIPPSVPMILYGVATGTSIRDMFLAGIVPGLIIAVTLYLAIYLISRRRGYTGNPPLSWGERLAAFRKASLALIMPLIILGGIYGGIFTPTEAGAVAVAYAFVVGVFVYREIQWSEILQVLARSAVLTSIIMFIIANVGLFGLLLSRQRAPQLATELFIGISDSPFVFLLLINVLLLLVGMFIETGAAIIILAPLLAPIALQFGIDPVHFGMIMIVNLAIGMCTPPLGVNLFISCEIAGISLGQITKALIPLFAVLILNLLIISYVPGVSLALPRLLGG